MTKTKTNNMAKYKLLPFCLKWKPTALLFSTLLWACFTKAQQASTASGGDASGNGGTVAYSVGQIVYTTHSATIGSVAQGVQHPYEIFSVVYKENALNILLITYPNPTTEFLTLKIVDYNNELLSFQLLDVNGKLMINGNIDADKTQINMKSLAAATYFIKVTNQENKKTQSFKIVKL